MTQTLTLTRVVLRVEDHRFIVKLKVITKSLECVTFSETVKTILKFINIFSLILKQKHLNIFSLGAEEHL